MPRGVYDRSAIKAKRSATKATKAANKAVVAAEMAISKTRGNNKAEVGVGYQAQEGSGQTSVSYDIYELRKQVEALVNAREKLAGNNQGQHNPTLITAFDTELLATIGSMKTWRETTFPVAEKKATATPTQQAQKQAAPAPTTQTAPAPAPAPAPGPAPAPLPFTPAAVQEVMKQAGQA